MGRRTGPPAEGIIEASGADAALDVAAEREALAAQLAPAYGLSGRARRAGSAAERARTAVTARIRDAIRRIEAVHPRLGGHLRASVRTGTFCSYRPATWQPTGAPVTPGRG